MKRKRPANKDPNSKSQCKRNNVSTSNELLQNGGNNNNNAHEILKLALERVCALQHELARETTDDAEQVDAETAGFAACAIETFRFLASEGLTADHPIIERLSEHLLGGNSNNYSSSDNSSKK